MQASPKLIKTLLRHEGTEKVGGTHVIYKDSEGYDTIGYGHRIKSKAELGRYKDGIDEATAKTLFKKDVEIAIQEAQKVIPNFDTYSTDRKEVFVNMMFNMGSKRLRGFKDMFHELRKGEETNWDMVSYHMHNSKWRKQVKGRATDLTSQVRDKEVTEEIAGGKTSKKRVSKERIAEEKSEATFFGDMQKEFEGSDYYKEKNMNVDSFEKMREDYQEATMRLHIDDISITPENTERALGIIKQERGEV